MFKSLFFLSSRVQHTMAKLQSTRPMTTVLMTRVVNTMTTLPIMLKQLEQLTLQQLLLRQLFSKPKLPNNLTSQ